MMSEEKRQVKDEDTTIREISCSEIIEALELVYDIREKREELAGLIAPRTGIA